MFRETVKSDNRKEKEFYDRSRLPPYLSAPTQPTSSAALSDTPDRGDGYLNDLSGEADVAAGEIFSIVAYCGALFKFVY